MVVSSSDISSIRNAITGNQKTSSNAPSFTNRPSNVSPGGYSSIDKGYVDKYDNVIATPEQIKANPEAARARALAASKQSFNPAQDFFSRLAGNDKKQNYAGTSSKKYGYVDTTGKTIATSNEITKALKANQLAAIQQKVYGREAQIKVNQQNIKAINRNIKNTVNARNVRPPQYGPRIEQKDQSFINRLSTIDRKKRTPKIDTPKEQQGLIDQRRTDHSRMLTPQTFTTPEELAAGKSLNSERIMRSGLSNIKTITSVAVNPAETTQVARNLMYGEAEPVFDKILNVPDTVEQTVWIDRMNAATTEKEVNAISNQYKMEILGGSKVKKLNAEKLLFITQLADNKIYDLGMVYVTDSNKILKKQDTESKLAEYNLLNMPLGDITTGKALEDKEQYDKAMGLAEKDYNTLEDYRVTSETQAETLRLNKGKTSNAMENIFSPAKTTSELVVPKVITPARPFVPEDIKNADLVRYLIKDDIKTTTVSTFDEQVKNFQKGRGETFPERQADGTYIDKFFYNSQRDADATTEFATTLAKTLDKKDNDKLETLQTNYENLYLNNDEIKILKANEKAALGGRTYFNEVILENLKDADWAYSRDNKLQDKIDIKERATFSAYDDLSATFKNPINEIITPKDIANTWVKGEEFKLKLASLLGTRFHKSTVGLVTKGAQGYTQLATETARDFALGEGPYDSTPLTRMQLSDAYGFNSELKKAGDLTAVAAVTGLGFATGGASFGLTAALGAVTIPVVGEAARVAGYAASNKEERLIRQDNETFNPIISKAWDAETAEVAKGWYNSNDTYSKDGSLKSGGWDGWLRGVVRDLPVAGWVPGLGADTKSFMKSAEDQYKALGYTEEQSKVAAKAAYKQRWASRGGEVVSILGANTLSEIAGRGAFSRAVIGGATGKSFATGFAKVGQAGIIEGGLMSAASQYKKYKPVDYGQLAEAGLMGFGTAGLIGGGMAWSGAGGKLNKALARGGYATDWYEKLGDMGADFLEKHSTGVAKFTKRIRPRVFTFSKTVGATTTTQNLNAADVVDYEISGNKIKVLTMQGSTKSFANTNANVKALTEMTTYIQSEEKLLLGTKSSTKADAQAKAINAERTINNDFFFGKSSANPNLLMDNNAKTSQAAIAEVLANSNINPNPNTNTRTNVNIASNTNINTQSNTNPNANINNQANTETQTQAQTQAYISPFANTNTMTGVFSSGMLLPYGRVSLPGQGGRGRGGKFMDTWLVDNKIEDYATPFFNKKPQQSSYDKANNAVDRLFGKNIASGQTFRNTYKNPITTANPSIMNSMKNVMAMQTPKAVNQGFKMPMINKGSSVVNTGLKKATANKVSKTKSLSLKNKLKKMMSMKSPVKSKSVRIPAYGGK